MEVELESKEAVSHQFKYKKNIFDVDISVFQEPNATQATKPMNITQLSRKYMSHGTSSLNTTI